jgi:hypothetical protein
MSLRSCSGPCKQVDYVVCDNKGYATSGTKCYVASRYKVRIKNSFSLPNDVDIQSVNTKTLYSIIVLCRASTEKSNQFDLEITELFPSTL